MEFQFQQCWCYRDDETTQRSGQATRVSRWRQRARPNVSGWLVKIAPLICSVVMSSPVCIPERIQDADHLKHRHKSGKLARKIPAEQRAEKSLKALPGSWELSRVCRASEPQGPGVSSSATLRRPRPDVLAEQVPKVQVLGHQLLLHVLQGPLVLHDFQRLPLTLTHTHVKKMTQIHKLKLQVCLQSKDWKNTKYFKQPENTEVTVRW